MESVKKISLITTLYNEVNNVLSFLESYKVQTKYADEFIIVDGGSMDNTVNIIEKFASENGKLNIKVIVDETCSKKYVEGPIARGRNVAIENTKYDYIAVTDAGCILDKNWFAEIITPFADKSVDVVSGWYEVNVTNEFQEVYKNIYLRSLDTLDLDTFLPSSRSIAFKKSAWSNIGGYPEGSMTAEDTKFDLDLKANGYKFEFNPKAVVYWDCPLNYTEAIEKASYYALGDGKNRLHFRNFFFRNFFLIFPVNIFLSKERREHFKLSYSVMFHYQWNYIKGVFL